MNDLKKLVGSLSQSGALNGFLGGVAGGGLTSMLTSKKGRKTGKKVAKYGALAAVGTVAWKAYQSYSQQNSAAPSTASVTAATASPPSRSYGEAAPMQTAPAAQASQLNYPRAQLHEEAFENVIVENEDGQLLLMRAMIATANADGHIDDNERQAIFNNVENMQLSVQEKAMLFDELRQPLTIHQLIAAFPDAQTGIEVYAASASAIDLTREVSQRYLHDLSSHLCIPRELVQTIHQELQAS